jgi:hypothetical protein
MAIDAVSKGGAPKATLEPLATGDWIGGCEASLTSTVIDELVESGTNNSLRAALWIVEAVAKSQPDGLREEAFRHATYRCCLAAAELGDPNLAYHYEPLVDRLQLTREERITVLMRALRNSELIWPSTVALVEHMARDDPEAVVPALVDALKTPALWQLSIDSGHVLTAAGRGAGTARMVESVMRCRPEEQVHLLQHFDFTSEELDPVVVRLLEQRDDETFLRAMNSRYNFPGEVVIGSYANYLQNRLVRLDRWTTEHESTAVRAWAKTLAQELGPLIDNERIREEEDPLG